MMHSKTYTYLNAISNINSPVGAYYLSHELGIPSATVGRQLQRLEKEGYLTSIGNKGRILTQLGKNLLAELDSLVTQQSAAQNLIHFSSCSSIKRIKQIIEIRLLLETYTATMACQNATMKQLEHLDLLSMEHLLDIKKGKTGAEHDLRFHLAIAEFSNNEVALQILKILLADNNVYSVLNTIASSLKRSEITCHDDIVHAIQSRNPAMAEDAMKTHLQRILLNIDDYQSINPPNEPVHPNMEDSVGSVISHGL